jgi:hypothetical protein
MGRAIWRSETAPKANIAHTGVVTRGSEVDPKQTGPKLAHLFQYSPEPKVF